MSLNSFIPKENYKKIFLLFTVLVGLFLNVFLVQTYIKFNLKAASTPVEISFLPDTAPIPPETSFAINVDPKFQTISFIKITLSFDPNILYLSSEVDISPSPLTGKLFVTSMSEANNTGKLVIILYQQAGQIGPSQPFQFVTLRFASLASQDVPQTAITVVDEESQIVGATSVELPFTSNYANINPAAEGGFGAGIPVDAYAVGEGASGNCPSGAYIDTAIGCIPFNDRNLLAQFLLAWGLGIAGGIAFILMVFSAYMIMTSSGNPDRLQAGKQLLTAAVSGLVMLILSVFILRLVGVDILGIIT